MNAASIRFDIDRNALTRFARGRRMSLELVEKWARSLGEDLNHWRELAGYEPAENTVHKIHRAFDELEQEFGEAFRPAWTEARHLRQHPEQIPIYQQRIREALRANP